MPSSGFDGPPLSGTGDSNHDPNATDPDGHRHGDMDYGVWQEGGRPTHVKCYTDIGSPPTQNMLDGMFRQHMRLESLTPFQVLHTTTLTDGPMSGCQAISIKPSVPFSLLKLPREIRDEIYAYSMTPKVFKHTKFQENPLNNGRIQFKQMSHPPRYRRITLRSYWRLPKRIKDEIVHHESVTPGLLLTSKQIHQEALPILYGRNCFRIDEYNQDALPTFLQQTGDSSKYIRNLRFEGFWKEPASCKHLEGLVHLRHLSVDSPYDLNYERIVNPAEAARLFFDKAFRRIPGVASVQEGEDQLRVLKYVEVDCPKNCPFECPGEDAVRNGISCQWIDRFRDELQRLIVDRLGVVIPFLKFPRKIRDMIYTYAMEYECPETTKTGGLDELHIYKDRDTGRLIRGSGCYYPEGRGYSHHDAISFHHSCYGLSENLTLGLLRVNRQVYWESVQVLYGLRSF